MKLAGCLIKLNSKLCMDDAFLIIAVGLSLRNSTLPSWLELPLSQVNVGATEGCVLHFTLLWLLPDAPVPIAVLLFSVLQTCVEAVWVVAVSADYMMVFYIPTEGFGLLLDHPWCCFLGPGAPLISLVGLFPVLPIPVVPGTLLLFPQAG